MKNKSVKTWKMNVKKFTIAWWLDLKDQCKIMQNTTYDGEFFYRYYNLEKWIDKRIIYKYGIIDAAHHPEKFEV